MKLSVGLILGIIMIGSPFLWSPVFSQENQTPPNFILILADDLGWPCTSFQMDDNTPNSTSDFFETPQLQQLAQMGMRFSQGYAPAALCSPTRRSIQLGMSPARLGDQGFKEKYYPQRFDLLTPASLLKKVNPAYKTAHYGKWDLRADIFPEDLGYDESDGNTGNGNGNVFSKKPEKWTKAFVRSDPKKIETITRRAMNFMERQVRNQKPFYLQLSHYATHVDMQTRAETLAKYKAKAKGEIHKIPAWAGMLEDLDTGIGQVLDKIEELNIEENTYIIFLADNGAVPFIPPGADYLAHPSAYPKPSRNFPLRGGKWNLYEGGIRVPFIVVGPGISPDTQCDHPVVGWDLLPTIVDLAGYQGPVPKFWDGQSFVRYFEDPLGKEMDRPDGLIFHRYHRSKSHSAMLSGDFKLIYFWKTGKMELYNLAKDPGELHNLGDSEIQKALELKRQLMDYLKRVDAEFL